MQDIFDQDLSICWEIYGKYFQTIETLGDCNFWSLFSFRKGQIVRLKWGFDNLCLPPFTHLEQALKCNYIKLVHQL